MKTKHNIPLVVLLGASAILLSGCGSDSDDNTHAELHDAQLIDFKVVVLPAPFTPNNPKTSPFVIPTDKLSTATLYSLSLSTI